MLVDFNTKIAKRNNVALGDAPVDGNRFKALPAAKVGVAESAIF